MIALLLSVCLADRPTVCKDLTLYYEANIPKENCYLLMPQMAEWYGKNPGWTITKFQCTKDLR